MSNQEQRGLLPFSHSCEAFKGRLDAWFDLGEAPRDALRREASRCSGCRSALEAQETLHRLVGEARLELFAGRERSSERGSPPVEVAQTAIPAKAPSLGRAVMPWAAVVLAVLALALLWSALGDREPTLEGPARLRSAPSVESESDGRMASPLLPAPAALQPPEVPPVIAENSLPETSAVQISSAQTLGVEISSEDELLELSPSSPSRPKLPSATAASAVLRSVKRPQLQAMRPSSGAGRFSFRVPTAPSRPSTASGR